jgi:hypothetical protein
VPAEGDAEVLGSVPFSPTFSVTGSVARSVTPPP